MPVLERTSMTPYYHKALHYLYYGSYKGGKLNRPHQNNNGVKVRNHLLTGVNCRTDSYKHTCKDWSQALKLNRRTKNKSINLVISFKKSEVNLEDPATCKSLALLARKFVKHAFGKDAIAIIALQDDNTNKTPHLHIDVANINLANHDRAINGKQRDIFRLRSINDSIIRKYNSQRLLQQEPKLSIVKSNVAKPHDKYLTKIARCIYRVASNTHVTSKSKFRKILKNKYHIRAHFIRPRKRKNGRKRRHKTYGVTFQYQTSPKIKGSKLNKIISGIRHQNLVHQFKINKDKNKALKKQARAKSMATSKAFDDYSNEVSMYYGEYSFNNDFDKRDYSSEVSSAEDRFGISADDVITSAKSSSSASKVYSTTSSAESIMAYVHAIDKNPFGSNEFFNSSTIDSAEDQIAFHPIPSSVSSSASTSSSATPASSSSNSIASANNSAFDKASSANTKSKHERKTKHDKEIKQSRLNQEAKVLDRQTKEYNRQHRIYEQESEKSSKSLAGNHHIFSWFTSKVKSAVHQVISTAVSGLHKVIGHILHRHRKHEFKNNMNNQSAFNQSLRQAAKQTNSSANQSESSSSNSAHPSEKSGSWIIKSDDGKEIE